MPRHAGRRWVLNRNAGRFIGSGHEARVAEQSQCVVVDGRETIGSFVRGVGSGAGHDQVHIGTPLLAQAGFLTDYTTHVLPSRFEMLPGSYHFLAIVSRADSIEIVSFVR